MVLVGVLFVPIYYFAGPLFSFVSAPLVKALPDGSSMIATAVTSPFLTPFKLAIYTAIFMASVFATSAMGICFARALSQRKTICLSAAVFQRHLVLRGHGVWLLFGISACIHFLGGYKSRGRADDDGHQPVSDFVLKMFLAFGIAFEIPVATFLLAWSGLSNADSMARSGPTSLSAVSWQACC